MEGKGQEKGGVRFSTTPKFDDSSDIAHSSKKIESTTSTLHSQHREIEQSTSQARVSPRPDTKEETDQENFTFRKSSPKKNFGMCGQAI